MQRLKNALVPFLEKELNQNQRKALKVHVGLKAGFEVAKPVDENEEKLEVVDRPSYYFNAKSRIFLPGDVESLSEDIQPLLAPLEHQIQDRVDRGSGFRYNALEYAQVTICEYSLYPIGRWFSSPSWIKARKATLNIRPSDPNDNACFLRAILGALLPPSKNAHRPKRYDDLFSVFNMDGISLPITTKKQKNLNINNVIQLP